MTGHAGVSRWDASERRLLNRRVAIAAIDAQAGDVMLMAERNRLDPRDILACRVRREVNRVNHAPKCEKSKDDCSKRNPGNTVASLSKDLSHGPEPARIKTSLSIRASSP